MKICTCGHKFMAGENFCPDCGMRIENIPETQEAAAPIGAVKPLGTPAAQSISQPQKPQTQNDGTKPVNSIFSTVSAPVASPIHAPKPNTVKKETPKPGPNVEVKPVANASMSKKTNPLKDPPPIESKFSVLSQSTTIIHVFIMMMPVVGLIYSLVFTLGVTKKENTRRLATAFLTAYLIQIVLFALAFLILSVFFKTTFNEICGIIKYMLDTFKALVK